MLRREFLTAGAAATTLLGMGRVPRRVAVLSNNRGPSLDLNFLAAALDSRISFTRASAAWGFNPAGSLVQFAANAPRLGPNGLLIEEQRTDLKLNNGAALSIGSARYSAAASADIAPMFAGDSVIKVTDTAGTGDTNCGFDNSIALTPGVTYCATCWVWIPASLTGSAIGPAIPGNTAGGIVVNANLALRNQWQVAYATYNYPTVTTGGLTLRAGTNLGDYFYYTLPGFEAGSFPTSPIPTAGTAVTRARDIAIVPNSAFPLLPSSVPFTLCIEGMIPVITNEPTTFVCLAHAGGKTGVILNANSTSIAMYDSIASLNRTVGTLVPGQTFKTAAAFGASAQAGCTNGGTVISQTATGLNTGFTELDIGNAVGLQQIGGYVHRVRLWPRALSNSELQAATT